jgi:hypothetical protein
MGLQQSTARADHQGGNLYRPVDEAIGNVEHDDNPSDSSNSRVSGAASHNFCWDMYIPTSFVFTIGRIVAKPSIKG